jgi:hypothetical protein
MVTAIEAPKQHGQLNCNQVVTLKDVFDAGFRPYRWTDDTCGIGKADISLVFPTSLQPVSLDVDSVKFGITKYDTVNRIDLRTAAKTVKESGEMLQRLASALGITLQGLDEAISRATPESPHQNDVWTQDWAGEWLKVRLGFKAQTYYVDDASVGYREMKSYIVLSIEWTPTEIGPTYREKPITPPKGYEHVSMEMPGSDLVKKAQTSNDPSLAHLRYSDEKQRQAILATTPASVPKPPTNQPSAQKNPAVAPPLAPSGELPSSTPWSIIFVLIVAALCLLYSSVGNRK